MSKNVVLSEKAGKFESFVEKYLVDEAGVIYSGINAETMRPWHAEDISEKDEFIPVENYQPWDIMNYEDCGMATGGHLAAMTFRFKVTGDENTLLRAQRSFRAIKHIYDIGSQKEEGLFPKIYGGRFTEQVSTDQYLYAMKALMGYLEISPSADEKKLIGEMIPKMVDYWVKRNYRHDYYNIKQMQWGLARFLPFLLMAWKVSGDEKYFREFKRLNETEKIYLKTPPESRLAPFTNGGIPLIDYEKRHGNRYIIGNFSECAAMDIMIYDECLRLSGDYTSYWLKSMQMMWREGKIALTDDGMEYVKIMYDFETGKAFPIPEPELIPGETNLNWSYARWLGNILSPRSCMLARVGVNVATWIPEENAMSTVMKILSDISLDDMREIVARDNNNILAAHRFMTRIFCTAAIVNWLWAYWQARYAGLIDKGN